MCYIENINFILLTILIDGVPYDGVVQNQTVKVHLSLTVIIIFMATCGIIFALACGFLHLHFRNKK